MIYEVCFIKECSDPQELGLIVAVCFAGHPWSKIEQGEEATLGGFRFGVQKMRIKDLSGIPEQISRRMLRMSDDKQSFKGTPKRLQYRAKRGGSPPGRVRRKKREERKES